MSIAAWNTRQWRFDRGVLPPPGFGVSVLKPALSFPPLGMEFYQAYIQQAAVTSQYGSAQVWNPEGSGVLLQILYANLRNAASSPGITYYGFSDTQDANSKTVRGSRPGIGVSARGLARSATYATSPTNNRDEPIGFRPGDLDEIISGQSVLVVPEGWGFTLRSSEANSAINATIAWLELPT